MADIICRWRNGTPATVVELVNLLPHIKMSSEQFRDYMEASKWGKEFFTAPYQLACQLALYCEAEDGYYYPRFNHDISEKEAEEYLQYWFPRYYLPNPYVRKDGFLEISCPTYLLKSLYEYAKRNSNSYYEDAYRQIFKEEPKNNDDIVKNYINRYAKVLTMDISRKLSITDYDPTKIFSFMDRNNKKLFFDSFSTTVDKMALYLNANNVERQKKYYDYVLNVMKKSERSAEGYAYDAPSNKEVLRIIKNVTNKDSLFEVTDILSIETIYQRCLKSQFNRNGKNMYSAAISNYKIFLNSLEEDDVDTQTIPSVLKEESTSDNATLSSSLSASPFSVKRMKSLIANTGLLYDEKLIKRFAFSLMSKQFLILSGLAGSGKTQLALAFASALVERNNQMCVVSVGADWTNREPLLGFPNALQANAYVRPESGVLDLLIEANKSENATKPFFLILDEMNMSYVERYFADFLSAMESHEAIPLWKGDDEDLTPQSINLPKNLYIIGTINVDETTYMFSPKVLDRANVIEFKISAKEMSQFLNNMKPVNRSSINHSGADMGANFVMRSYDSELASEEAIANTLNDFFTELKGVNAEFGYRSATEIYRFVCIAQKNDDTDHKLSLNEILDCAIVQKLLPKLHGSRKKLDSVLQTLWKKCLSSEQAKAYGNISKDFVSEAKYPLAADKIQRMYQAAFDNGFTSFAEA